MWGKKKLLVLSTISLCHNVSKSFCCNKLQRKSISILSCLNQGFCCNFLLRKGKPLLLICFTTNFILVHFKSQENQTIYNNNNVNTCTAKKGLISVNGHATNMAGLIVLKGSYIETFNIKLQSPKFMSLNIQRTTMPRTK